MRFPEKFYDLPETEGNVCTTTMNEGWSKQERTKCFADFQICGVDFSFRSGNHECDAEIIRTLLLEIERRAVEKLVSMDYKVIQRYQDLNWIANNRTTGQSSNENACFSSVVFQGDYYKCVSTSNEKNEKNDLIQEFDTVFIVKLSRKVFERCTLRYSWSIWKITKREGSKGRNKPCLPWCMHYLQMILKFSNAKGQS